MKRTVLAVLLAVAAIALAAKTTTSGAMSNGRTPAVSDPRVVAIRAQQAQAAAQGDEALARQLEAQAQKIYLEYQTQPGSAAGATVAKPWHGQSLGLEGSDVVIGTGTISATAADYEMDGTMWVAYSKSADSGVYITRSTDHGATWQGLFSIFLIPTTLVKHLGLVVGQGDSGFVYAFCVHPSQHGDMLCIRFNKDGTNFQNFWVKSDNDSINDFKVCRDYSGSDYYLYCVAGNDDHSTNFDDFMLRSTDYGKTWASTNTFRFVSDGSYTAGSGKFLYLAGHNGYSPYKGQLDLLVDTLWGAWSGSFREVDIAPDTFTVMDPVIAPSFATPVESAVVWTLYSHNSQNTGDWDMKYIYSTDAGVTWSASYYLAGSSSAEERFGDIKPYTSPGNTWMNASYISESTYRTVYRHYCEQSTPTSWSDTLRINTNSAGTGQSVRPLLVYSPGAPGTGAGCVFTGAGLSNIYWNAPWTTAVAEPVAPGPVRLGLVPTVVRGVLLLEGDCSRTGTVPKAVLLDAAGRKVMSLVPGSNDVSHVAAGVYFVRETQAQAQAVRRVVIQR
jgi:hypothetical protein